MIEVGEPFPDFALPNQDNRTVKLSDLRGKWAVIWVYPKDDTPGCTLEGRGFSAMKGEYEKIGAVAFGLSEDDAASKKAFCDKYGFGISLLADQDHKLLKTLGVGQSEWKGAKYWDRTSFLIDPSGIVRKVYAKVKPEGHEKEVLEDIRKLQGG